MKNKAWLIVLAFVLLIPTAVAVISYIGSKNAPADAKTAVKITIKDLAGHTFELEKKEDGDAGDRAIKMFLSFKDNATRLTALPDQLMGTASFLVTISTNVKDSVYNFYFSANPESAYLLCDDGGAYQIKPSDAEIFLATEFAVSVYNHAELPSLLLSDKYVIKPCAASWQYKNLTGSYVIADTGSAVTGDVLNYQAENGIKLNFSMEPDYFNLKISDFNTGEVYFDDLYKNISALSITSSTKVKIEASAKWYKDSLRDYYGELDYVFTSDISAPATFHLTTYESLEPGDIVAVTGFNVADAAEVQFSSSPDIGYQPKFIKDGDSVYALIPLSYSLSGGDYTFSLTYAGITQKLTLKINNKKFDTSYKNVSNATYNSYYNEVSIREAEETLAPYLSYSANRQYWEGTFLEGVDGIITCGFGRYYKIIAGGVDTGVTVRQDGIDYFAAKGKDVSAVNSGEVIYTGYLDLWGNIVIIEHGYGLKSWYCNLDKYTVSIGQKVTKGDKIGECGQSGFIHQNGAHIILSVFDVPVCPYDVWENGIELYKKSGNGTQKATPADLS